MKQIVLVTILLILNISLPSCQFGGISYHDFEIGEYYWNTDSAAKLWVINSLQEYKRPQEVEWRPNGFTNSDLPEPPPEISDFDFAHYFLIVVFNGIRGGLGYGTHISTKGIRQDNDIIYVTFKFSDPGPGAYKPVINSPTDFLKIKRDNLIQGGELTFILLDTSGKERAKSTYEVQK